MKRNRQQRYDALIYAVTPIMVDRDLVAGIERALEVDEATEVEGHLVVTVPPTATEATCEELKARLEDELKKPVIVMTNNTRFARLRKLAPKEAARIVKQVEGDREAAATDDTDG